jgi:hypothetical protein
MTSDAAYMIIGALLGGGVMHYAWKKRWRDHLRYDHIVRR